MSSRSRDTSATPDRCLLANGPLPNGAYSVMLSASGAGFSRWRGMAVTRWREDPVGDAWGSYLLLRDEASGCRVADHTSPLSSSRSSR